MDPSRRAIISIQYLVISLIIEIGLGSLRDEQLIIVQAKIAGPLALTWHRRYKQYANC